MKCGQCIHGEKYSYLYGKVYCKKDNLSPRNSNQECNMGLSTDYSELNNQITNLKREIENLNELLQTKDADLRNKSKQIDQLEEYVSSSFIAGYAHVLESTGYLDKSLCGRNRMFAYLRQKGYLQSAEKYKNSPYQRYYEQELFKTTEEVLPTGKTVFVTTITNKGKTKFVADLKLDGKWHSDKTYQEALAELNKRIKEDSKVE